MLSFSDFFDPYIINGKYVTVIQEFIGKSDSFTRNILITGKIYADSDKQTFTVTSRDNQLTFDMDDVSTFSFGHYESFNVSLRKLVFDDNGNAKGDYNLQKDILPMTN